MKTAISVSDETFEAVDRRAQSLGISRSEFYAIAARRYLEELDRESLTRQIDEALSQVDGDESWSDAVEAGRARLATGDDW